jgi:hypothetical protein
VPATRWGAGVAVARALLCSRGAHPAAVWGAA